MDPPTLKQKLDAQLDKADGEYVVVTGPPGSGKSTALTAYCDGLQEHASGRFAVVRYYCFVGVNDNRQRLRLEANSLRVNVLTELRRRFPTVLDDRRFDFSENRFHETFERVACHCGENGIKLVVLLDGLDHVERDKEIRESVIAALPAAVPQNIVLLIGTQELSRWKPVAMAEGRKGRHVDMPLFSWEETRTYVVDRCGISLAPAEVSQVFEKSAGLPLYLRYLAETLASSEDPAASIGSMPAAVDGDVRSYYAALWAGFESDGPADAKYLSYVLAGLRFRVHEDELRAFQTGIPDTPRFEAAYDRIRHLLRRDGDLISIFHNSFRFFVLGHINATTHSEIATGILSRLKSEELNSARWFQYAFRYALEAGDFEYVINRINLQFVDAALMCLRRADEIADAIECGIEAAGKTGDLVALSRLGVLKYRTQERLDHIFPWVTLADVLLQQGRVDQVVSSVYSEETGRIVANKAYSLHVMLKLAELGRGDLGEELFAAYLRERRGGNRLDKQNVVTLARCAGVFATRMGSVVRWLSDAIIRRDILEPEELSSEYAPHLAAYLGGLVQSGRERVWRRLARINRPFSNRLTRQLTIRAVAEWGRVEQLRRQLDDYIAAYPDDTNVELAFYATQAGLPAELVNQLAGDFPLPPDAAPHDASRADLLTHVLRFAYWSVVFGYCRNHIAVSQLRGRLNNSRAVWTSAQLHLLKVGEVLGSHHANREIDWFVFATEAIEALEAATDVMGERTPDTLDAARSILAKSLRWLSTVITKRCPGRLSDWGALLLRLRSSFLWTTHYGIGELMTDYSFEFEIWDTQADLPLMPAHLRPILVDCECSYSEALSLKGGARGVYFLSLAALAAKCGFANEASTWLEYGVRTSLAYGYRKDVTLEKLTDVLGLLGKYRPGEVLPNAAAILEMVKWIPHATDGRCTKHFAQYLLPTIMVHNRAAALEVLRTYYREFARWQADESLTKYILARDGGDPEFLWALCGLLDPNESVEPRQHIADLAASINPSSDGFWKTRLSHYVRTMVNPRHWPDDLWEQATQCHRRPERTQRGGGSNLDNLENKTYQLNGQPITKEEAIQRCRVSFSDMTATIDTVESENEYFPVYELLDVLPEHIESVTNTEELDAIRLFQERRPRLDTRWWEEIGRKYLSFGGTSHGLECLERAIHETPTSSALSTLIEYDRERAIDFLVTDLTERLHGPEYYGFEAPYVVANACDLLGMEEKVAKVFSDYLAHCQELFSQWPDDRKFDGLRDWGDAKRSENTQVVHLLVDRLALHATEFSHRLVCTVCMLAECRSEEVFPVLAERFASADGLLLWRFVLVYSRLSHASPDLLRRHYHVLLPLLERDDVFLALTASRTVRGAFADETLPDSLTRPLDAVERRYSSIIRYRGFSILTTQHSDQFVELTRRAAQLSFHRQLKALCDILDLDLDSIIAHLERLLIGTGTTLDEEEDTARSMANAFSHAQGWPIIWYTSDFHFLVSSLLYQTVDEVLAKRSYQPDHLEAVWRVIQQSDPEYSNTLLDVKPEEIRPLVVCEKDAWLSSDEGNVAVSIKDTLPDEWVTVFEFRQLEQDTPYHREFVAQTHVCSALVNPTVISQIASVPGTSWGEAVGTHHPFENLTWKQFREALCTGRRLQPDGDEDCLPMVSFKERHPGFLGFHTIASLSSWLIQERTLELDGFSVFAGDEKVAHFEAWQEGHSDEDYSDEALSFGLRVRARRDFLVDLCRDTGRAFAVRTVESRFAFKDYQPKPHESSSRTIICVWPLDVTTPNQ